MIWGCQCPVPRVHTVHANKCEGCGRFLDPRFIDSDENLNVFRGRLEAIPDTPGAALDHARQRELQGRRQFGLQYLDRNNYAEGREEGADGVNYSMYAWLRGRRFGVEDIDPHLLAAARHFALAHQELIFAERGEP